MKNILTKIMLLAFTIFTISVTTSCSPDDGKDGKDGINGVDGTNGTNGTNGIDGLTGPAGPTGTANVIYSAWTPANFVAIGTAYRFSIPLPTSIPFETLLNTYHVSVYYTSNGSALEQLPSKDFNLNAEFTYILGSSGFVVQAARAGVAVPDAINPFVGTNPSDKVRYILIPASVLTARGISKPDYSKMSYHEICAKFNIPE